MWIQRWVGGGGGGGGQDPLENYKKIGFLSNTSPVPLKITKLPSQHSMLGHHWPYSEMPFKWCFAGGPLNSNEEFEVESVLTVREIVDKFNTKCIKFLCEPIKRSSLELF